MTSPTPPAREKRGPPNTASPPPPSAVKLSPQQIEALARFYELGLTPVDKELLAALRELAMLRNSHDALVALIEELRNDFINIVVGGCTCGTKPPDPALHELNCHYRMAEAGLARIETHRAARGDGK